MKERPILAVSIIIMFMLIEAQKGFAQPSYWVALNFQVTFNADGTVVVAAKLHPFTVDGKSLLNDKEVEADIRNQSAETLSYILLMFSDNPRLLKFQVLTNMEKRYGESVLCDVAGTGRMSQFQGAYVYSVKIYLNTSNYVRQINDSIFEVRVRDSFTSVDPRSWIDVLEIAFNGTQPLNIDWEPKFAKGPSIKSQNTLTWINFNEQDAPDVYVFEMRIPGLKHVGEPAEVNAILGDALLQGNTLRVTVQNLDSASGYVYVVVESGNQQARKVYLFSRENKEVVFPSINERNVTILLYSGDKLLDSRKVQVSRETPFPVTYPPKVYGVIIIIIAIAVFSVFAIWVIKKSRKKKEVNVI